MRLIAARGLALLVLAGCAPEPGVAPVDRATALRAEALPVPYASLVERALPLGDPAPGSWRFGHDEKGQSLAEYRALRAARPPRAGSILELTTLGRPGAAHARIVARTGEYLAAFWGLDVRAGAAIDPALVAAAHRRDERGFGPQFESRYVLDSILVARRPPDALGLMALSVFDLYPEESWNFVFGQASPAQGTGVWSMARFGDPEESADMELAVLSRTLRTSAHEVGHVLGLAHCITWHCLMNGSNSVPELDSRPLELCPACLAKACGDRALDPVERAARVAGVLEQAGLGVDGARFRAEARILRGED
jgi:archaemetzincin